MGDHGQARRRESLVGQPLLCHLEDLVSPGMSAVDGVACGQFPLIAQEHDVWYRGTRGDGSPQRGEIRVRLRSVETEVAAESCPAGGRRSALGGKGNRGPAQGEQRSMMAGTGSGELVG